MWQYIVRRLLLIVPVLLGVSITVFVIMRFIPGDPAVITLGERATPETIAQVRSNLRLDDPVPVQYLAWLKQILQGDLGKSIESGRPVRSEMWSRFPVTLELLIVSLIVSVAIGLPAGILAAIYQNSPIDYVVRVVSMSAISIPSFWLGQMLIVLPSIWWNHSPPFGYRPFLEDPWTNIQQFYLPGLALGAASAALLMRLMRSTLLEVLRSDYVRTAWSKGLRGRVVILRHALKNGLIPVVTVIGLQVAGLMGGAIVMEQVFALPGLGRLMLNSIQRRDYPVVQGIVLFMGTVYVIVNLSVDLVYGLLDPRIRYS